MKPRRFRALRAFLRGYLHQDVIVVYGRAVAAAAQFRADADQEHAEQVREELKHFAAALKDADLNKINQAVQELGSTYVFESVAEWQEFCDVLLKK